MAAVPLGPPAPAPAIATLPSASRAITGVRNAPAMPEGDAGALASSTPLSPAVLAFPTVLDDAELYSFSNESLDGQSVDLIDALTGAHIRFTLQGQRGAALLLDRQGKVLASYGGAAVATQ